MKGSKVLRKAGEQEPKAGEQEPKAGEQEPKAGEFQGRAEGVVQCEEFHTSAGPNAQVHG